ncbi:hypothetical protein DWU98_06425 [Dyella monticola]|uniref:Flagellar biosynthetic protein FlhB n=1 Tax=Dyella monticola TaxID=1927958 RepID=A0A370X2Z4_9GAMM|nr:EscU/YscU/HrcU family type III secretion system export apparatus switch protein [Dyella monticola]RDS82783.1 hypothetical protein DWU98_06425 [Dyella monticola]
MSNKTKQPTPQRLKEAAERGDIPKSQSFSLSMTMLAWWMLIPLASTVLLRWVAPFIDDVVSLRVMDDQLASRSSLLEFVGMSLAVPCSVALLLALSLGFIQSKGRTARKRTVFDLKRINPASGIKQLFSPQKLINTGISIVKGLMIGAACFRVGQDLLAALSSMSINHVSWRAAFSAALIDGWKASGFAVLGCVGIGACDLLIQHKLWIRRNRMSDDEIKREYKEQEGSPEVKSARRRLHRELSS